MLVRATFNDQIAEIAAPATGDPLVWQNAAIAAITVLNSVPGDLRVEGSAPDIAALVTAGVIVNNVFQFLRVVAT